MIPGDSGVLDPRVSWIVTKPEVAPRDQDSADWAWLDGSQVVKVKTPGYSDSHSQELSSDEGKGPNFADP